jgi:hypothetical protein
MRLRWRGLGTSGRRYTRACQKTRCGGMRRKNKGDSHEAVAETGKMAV